jgi:DNA-binding MarR family transcriptional regulator
MTTPIKQKTLKLSSQQAEFLILINDRSEIGSEGRFWVPPHSHRSYSDTLQRDVPVSGAGSANTLKSLEKKGLIEYPDIDMAKSCYYFRITEEGRLLVESWRETDTWPVTFGRNTPCVACHKMKCECEQG